MEERWKRGGSVFSRQTPRKGSKGEGLEVREAGMGVRVKINENEINYKTV